MTDLDAAREAAEAKVLAAEAAVRDLSHRSRLRLHAAKDELKRVEAAMRMLSGTKRRGRCAQRIDYSDLAGRMDEFGVPINFARQQLMPLLKSAGISRESLSHVIIRLTALGVIRRTGHSRYERLR